MLTVKEAAIQLGVSPRTVLRRITSGTLRASKQGAHWMIDDAAVQKLEPQQQESQHDVGLLPGEDEFISWITERKRQKDALTQ